MKCLVLFASAWMASLALAANPTDTNSTPAGERQLAEQILADQTLHDVHQRAQTLLKDGLNAGSGYGEVWIRDLNTFIEVALEVNEPARFREALMTFFRFQGPDGDIVDGYIPKDRASVGYKYRSSESAGGLLAHKNTVETDQESSLVQAIFKYVRTTGDRSILDEEVQSVTVRERLGRALEFVLAHRWDKEHGLVWGATTVDWGDVQPESPWGVELDAQSHRALDIYDNAMMVIAINDYVQLLGDNTAAAARWRAACTDLKRNIRRYLWDAENQKFIPHVYLDGSPFPKGFDEKAIYYHGGTAVAIEAGLLSHEEVVRSLEQMRANVRTAGAGSIGLTVFPPYPRGLFRNPQMSEPYSYQNGGDWCWFGGRMVQQLIKQGLINDAYRELKPMVERANRYGFHEWWSRDNQPQGSGQFRGSAGVLGRAIELLEQWAAAKSGHVLEPKFASPGEVAADALRLEAQVLAESEAGIERNRKGDVVVRILDTNGQPIPHARVTVEQTRHEFLFGCNIYGFDQFKTAAENEKYKRRFAELFNYATVGFYWRWYEPEEGKPQYAHTDRVIDWCREHRIRMKGHPLLWADEAGIPTWSPGQPRPERQKQRVFEIMQRYQGRIESWEVVNEPSHLPELKIDSPYRWAREADPKAVLIVNDYHIMADGQPAFYGLLERADQHGVPFDGIGIQAHEPRTMRFPLARVKRVLDHYGGLGKGLHITEFTPTSAGQPMTGSPSHGSWDEAAQAAYATQFYRVCFAHPSVVAITWWDLCDAHSWLKGGGMLRADLTPKPVYEALRDLTHTQWHTRAEGATDDTGRFAFRGFFGDYEIRVLNPRRSTGAFHFSKNGPKDMEVRCQGGLE